MEKYLFSTEVIIEAETREEAEEKLSWNTDIDWKVKEVD